MFFVLFFFNEVDIDKNRSGFCGLCSYLQDSPSTHLCVKRNDRKLLTVQHKWKSQLPGVSNSFSSWATSAVGLPSKGRVYLGSFSAGFRSALHAKFRSALCAGFRVLQGNWVREPHDEARLGPVGLVSVHVL